jgi:ribosome-binding factor A
MAARSSRRRPDQVGEVVRQVVAEALLHELRDPRIGLVTVTRVEITPDLSRARIGISVHGDESAEAEAALAGLRSAAGFLRGKVARALATRVTPELVFDIDRGQEHARRIDQLLAEVREEDDA